MSASSLTTGEELGPGSHREARRAPRAISEREIAIAAVLELAEHSVSCGTREFSLLGFYDDDAEYLKALRERLGVQGGTPFDRKLSKVVRHLVRHGVLYARMRGTHKEYLGEPAKQMNYGFVNPGKYALLRRG